MDCLEADLRELRRCDPGSGHAGTVRSIARFDRAVDRRRKERRMVPMAGIR